MIILLRVIFRFEFEWVFYCREKLLNLYINSWGVIYIFCIYMCIFYFDQEYYDLDKFMLEFVFVFVDKWISKSDQEIVDVIMEELVKLFFNEIVVD